jgi:tetratricopeptide (TPR) repeat protein
LLLENGDVTAEQVAAALKHQEENGGLVGQILVANGDCADTAISAALLKQVQVTDIKCDELAIPPDITALVPREPLTLDWERFMWPEAVTWFARGLGAAHQGKVDEARRAGTRLHELEDATGKIGEELFARHIRILRLEVQAWLAHAEQETKTSVTLLGEAASLEETTPKPPVTPAPTLPAHELLGDLLLEQKRPAEALAAYKRSLELYPKRFNSLLGAARASRVTGDEASAQTFYRELLKLADGRTRQTALNEAHEFVDQKK